MTLDTNLSSLMVVLYRGSLGRKVKSVLALVDASRVFLAVSTSLHESVCCPP